MNNDELLTKNGREKSKIRGVENAFQITKTDRGGNNAGRRSWDQLRPQKKDQ